MFDVSPPAPGSSLWERERIENGRGIAIFVPVMEGVVSRNEDRNGDY